MRPPLWPVHPVNVRVAYGRHEVVEGPKSEGVVILEFPTIEAEAWYTVPAYREAREHRFKGLSTSGDCQGV